MNNLIQLKGKFLQASRQAGGVKTKLPKDERHILERAYYVIRDYIESEISHKTFN